MAKGAREAFATGFFECRPIAQERLAWFKVSNSPNYSQVENKTQRYSKYPLIK
jgi:hypothetical protein